MGFGIKSKLKRRNLEKRKEKSRDAARTRRSRETEIFLSLSKEIPVSFSLLSQMDKASIIRLAITHLKLRKFCEKVLKKKKAFQTFPSAELESKLNKLYYKALNGFVMVLSNTGNLIFITESILQHLGLSQVDLLGHSVFEFIHPCDHSELKDICGINKPNSLDNMKDSFDHLDSSNMQGIQQRKSFFIRMRCIHPCKGRSLSLKTNAYKVIHCSGFLISHNLEKESCKYSQEDVSFLVMECDSILHPSSQSIKLDSRSFVSHHTMDMKFIYCDDGVTSLLGYSPEQLNGNCIYEFHHALDNNSVVCAYRTLFSKGQSSTGLYRFLARSGGYAWVETQASLVKNPQTDKPQSVICINSVVSGILFGEEMYGLVQHSPLKSTLYNLEDSSDTLFNHLNACSDSKIDNQCLYDNSVESEILMTKYLSDSDDTAKVEVDGSVLCKNNLDNGVLFSTEKILNSAKASENEIQPYLESLALAGSQVTSSEAGLPNVSSNASLFKLLKEFDDDEMRAPFIPSDDLVFVDNTWDSTFFTTIEDDDVSIFARESINFDDNADDIIDGKRSLVASWKGSELPLDPNDIVSCKDSAGGHAILKKEGCNDLPSTSVLKNLLIKGEDTNYGYRLTTDSQNWKYEKADVKRSRVSAIYHFLCQE